ncbi:MAG: LemA family protein [Acholeplasmatales bacterium]|jgi:LemA protein|nr:LemA family protein [Acholeplasmatales bacterium]
MANELDEINGSVNKDGRDVNVIDKQIPVSVGVGSLIFEIVLWVLGIIPGLVFLFIKISARNYLRKLQQRIQHDASQIDNYLENRVVILQNVVGLVEKSVKLDKDIMLGVAAYRSGISIQNDNERNTVAQGIESTSSKIRVALEQYPTLSSQATIANAMQQNSYLQKEITAARGLYNDTVSLWNQEIFSWPAKMIVAAKAGYTTRIPFTASSSVKEQARTNFFK